MSPSKPQDFERVSVYNLSEKDQEELLSVATECVFNWCTKDSWPMGVIMSCLWAKDRIWLTAGAHRHRISAVRRNPQVSVVVTSTGTHLGGGKTVTIKGRCTVHEGREIKDWFYPVFARRIRPDDELAATTFQNFLDSPDRVIIEFRPDYKLGFDSALMWTRSPDAASNKPDS